MRFSMRGMSLVVAGSEGFALATAVARGGCSVGAAVTAADDSGAGRTVLVTLPGLGDAGAATTFVLRDAATGATAGAGLEGAAVDGAGATARWAAGGIGAAALVAAACVDDAV
jgi:hypothetical protein